MPANPASESGFEKKCLAWERLVQLRRRRLRARRFFGSNGFDASLNRTDKDMSIASFEARHTFYAAVRGQIAGKAHEELFAEICVCNFPPTELDDRFHAIAFLEKADGVIFLEIVVVVVGVGAEFQLFDLDDVLFLLSVMLLFFLFVLVVAEIDGFGDWRDGRRGDEDKVKAEFLRFAQSRRRRHHFVGAIGEDGADLTCTNEFVHVLSAILPARRKVSAGKHFEIMRWGQTGTKL